MESVRPLHTIQKKATDSLSQGSPGVSHHGEPGYLFTWRTSMIDMKRVLPAVSGLGMLAALVAVSAAQSAAASGDPEGVPIDSATTALVACRRCLEGPTTGASLCSFAS